jgi:integrase
MPTSVSTVAYGATGRWRHRRCCAAHIILHKAFADAVRWGYLDYNPADAADPPSQRLTESARRGSIRIWTAEQVKRFETIIAEQSGQLYALWLLVALTGLRRSEALGLRWTDVDLARGRVSVRQVIVKVGSRAVVKDAPKSNLRWTRPHHPAPPNPTPLPPAFASRSRGWPMGARGLRPVANTRRVNWPRSRLPVDGISRRHRGRPGCAAPATYGPTQPFVYTAVLTGG